MVEPRIQTQVCVVSEPVHLTIILHSWARPEAVFQLSTALWHAVPNLSSIKQQPFYHAYGFSWAFQRFTKGRARICLYFVKLGAPVRKTQTAGGDVNSWARKLSGGFFHHRSGSQAMMAWKPSSPRSLLTCVPCGLCMWLGLPQGVVA